MTGEPQTDAHRQAAKSLYRGLVRTTLARNVDPNDASHNPVFMRDGALNYYYSNRTLQRACSFLRETGVLEEGFNRAHRLTVPFDQLDVAADSAFARGIDHERMVEMLIAVLDDEVGSLYTNSATFPKLEVSPDPIATTVHHPNEAVEMESVMENLQILGYVELTQPETDTPSFQWTPAARPLLERQYIMPTVR